MFQINLTKTVFVACLIAILPINSSTAQTPACKSTYYKINNSNTDFTISDKNSFGPANIPTTDVKIIDTNGDGQNDSVVLAVGRHDGGQSLLCNITETIKCAPIGYKNSPTVAVATGHFDDDKILDIVLANGDCFGSNCVDKAAAVILFNKDGYEKENDVTNSDTGGARSIVVADMNDDGLDDIALGFAEENDNQLLINNSSSDRMTFSKIMFDNLGAATLGITAYDKNFITTSRKKWSSSSLNQCNENSTNNGITNYNNSKVIYKTKFGCGFQAVGLAAGKLDKAEPNSLHLVITAGGEANKPAQQANIWTIDLTTHPLIASKQITIGAPAKSRPVLIYDVNNDGHNDIIIGNLNGSDDEVNEYSYIYINDGKTPISKTTFNKRIKIPGSNTLNPRGMDIGLFNDDLYLFFANYCGPN